VRTARDGCQIFLTQFRTGCTVSGSIEPFPSPRRVRSERIALRKFAKNMVAGSCSTDAPGPLSQATDVTDGGSETWQGSPLAVLECM